MAFEVGEALLPELPILFRPARNVLDPIRLELIDALTPFPSLADQTRFAQHAQVPRDCRTAHTKSGDELVHMRITAPKPIEDRPSRWIGNCEKYVGCCGSAWHNWKKVTFLLPILQTAYEPVKALPFLGLHRRESRVGRRGKAERALSGRRECFGHDPPLVARRYRQAERPHDRRGEVA